MEKIESDRSAALGFSYFRKIGPVTFKKLSIYFPNLTKAFLAPASELERAGLSPKLVEEFISFRNSFKISDALDELKKDNIKFICLFEKNYPKILKEIFAPPFILYYRGNLDYWPKNCLAVVGSRQPSSYGQKIITKILPSLIKHRIAIISGLACGLDTMAHQSAILNKGKTFAILGSGLKPKNIYPAENQPLTKKIIETGGAIISEFPPDTKPLRQNFPQRNRIISGLSQAVLIIEAKEKSGSLITAACALDQNREVMAIPGSIFSELSSGTNKLIGQGAKIVFTAQDILDFFEL
jgi:DNA processing protein